MNIRKIQKLLILRPDIKPWSPYLMAHLHSCVKKADYTFLASAFYIIKILISDFLTVSSELPCMPQSQGPRKACPHVLWLQSLWLLWASGEQPSPSGKVRSLSCRSQGALSQARRMVQGCGKQSKRWEMMQPLALIGFQISVGCAIIAHKCGPAAELSYQPSRFLSHGSSCPPERD